MKKLLILLAIALPLSVNAKPKVTEFDATHVATVQHPIQPVRIEIFKHNVTGNCYSVYYRDVVIRKVDCKDFIEEKK